MATVPFKLITPVAVRFDGEAELVIAVGSEGETGILPHHAPYLTTVRPGVLRATVVEGSGTKRLELATGEGFLQVLPDRITLLVVPGPGDPQARESQLRKAVDRIQALCPTHPIHIDVKECDSIPLTSAGKHRFTRSDENAQRIPSHETVPASN